MVEVSPEGERRWRSAPPEPAMGDYLWAGSAAGAQGLDVGLGGGWRLDGGRG